MSEFFAKVDPSWLALLDPTASEILDSLQGQRIAPEKEDVFAAFSYPINHYRVVIVGQDPYPTPGMANGLAFSVNKEVKKIPPTLRNIFKEYSQDLRLPIPSNGDLSQWNAAGVLLLNRHLTISEGESGSHLHLGWAEITNSIAETLGDSGVIALLWGRHAQELRKYFLHVVESVHPSPLSAYRGFFGSRPFSTVNRKLIELGREPIDWNLG